MTTEARPVPDTLEHLEFEVPCSVCDSSAEVIVHFRCGCQVVLLCRPHLIFQQTGYGIPRHCDVCGSRYPDWKAAVSRIEPIK